WHKRLGVLGALGSCASFIGTVTIIPFMPDGWAASAGGFPAMAGNVPFLMKDVVLFAVSVYLLRQDVARVSRSTPQSELVLAGPRLQAARGNRRRPSHRRRVRTRRRKTTPRCPPA